MWGAGLRTGSAHPAGDFCSGTLPRFCPGSEGGDDLFKTKAGGSPGFDCMFMASITLTVFATGGGGAATRTVGRGQGEVLYFVNTLAVEGVIYSNSHL